MKKILLILLFISSLCHSQTPGINEEWLKTVKSYSDFAVSDTTTNMNLYTFDSTYVVHDVKLQIDTAFTGGSITSCDFNLSYITNVHSGIVAQYTDALEPDFSGIESAISPSTGSTIINLAAYSSGDNLDQATSGQVTVWVKISKLP